MFLWCFAAFFTRNIKTLYYYMQSFKCCPSCPSYFQSAQLAVSFDMCHISSHRHAGKDEVLKSRVLIINSINHAGLLARWRAFSSADERVGHDSRGYTAGAGVITRGIHVLLVLPTFCPVKGEEQASNCCALPGLWRGDLDLLHIAASSDVSSEYKMDQNSPQS